MAGSTVNIVVDIGNTRVKWRCADPGQSSGPSSAMSLDAPEIVSVLWDAWQYPEADALKIAVSSVNPPFADRLESFLADRGRSLPLSIRWYRSAKDVPVRHQLANPETTGADRALAVLGAIELIPMNRSCLIVSCGTAVTIERITWERVWQGGAITLGLGLASRTLHRNTAQLPYVGPSQIPSAWGNSTRPALEAGIFWGVVGAIKELIERQRNDLPGDPLVVWTGGDAEILARAVEGANVQISPDLVLRGLSLTLGEADESQSVEP